MKSRMRFDYFYGSQAEQFSFIRIPRILIKDPRFSPLSVYAKMLYAVLLDRMSLSSKNGWFDEDNRVYIIYPTAEAQEDLGIGKKKALEVMSELVEFGLLEKKRRGLGLPNLLYLKSFMSGGTEADTSVSKTIINRKCQSETSGGVQTDSSESFPQEPAEVSGPVLPEVLYPGPQRKKKNTEMGKVVEVWQKIVGVKTKAATIAFQQKHKLEVDGIAGPQSWGARLRTVG